MGRYVGEFDINRGHGRCRIIICADSGEGVPSFRGGGGCADPCVVTLLANRIGPVDVNHAGPGVLRIRIVRICIQGDRVFDLCFTS